MHWTMFWHTTTPEKNRDPCKWRHILYDPLIAIPSLSHQGSISPTFYEQLLGKQIPKSAIRYWWLDCLFALLGSVCIKAVSKHVGEIDHRIIFIDHLMALVDRLLRNPHLVIHHTKHSKKPRINPINEISFKKTKLVLNS